MDCFNNKFLEDWIDFEFFVIMFMFSEGVIRSILSLINVIDVIFFKFMIDCIRMFFNEFSKFFGWKVFFFWFKY